MDYKIEKIGNTIIEAGIDTYNEYRERNTIRAVIIKENKVLMLYSKLFDDYTFPGGGIKSDEDHREALARELREEVGANKIEVIKPVGYTEEIRYGINSSENIYLQKSFYYLCNISDIRDPEYVGREKEQGLSTKYIDPKEIIKHNELVNKQREISDNKGFQTVLIRENLVLDHILKNFL